jgi:hypothetical protein
MRMLLRDHLAYFTDAYRRTVGFNDETPGPADSTGEPKWINVL